MLKSLSGVRVASILSVLPFAAIAQPGLAQTANPQAQETVSGEILLDPVIITGLRRKELAEDYAGSVSVLEGDSTSTVSAEPGAAITRQVPNFSFTGFGQPGTDFVNIRGIGILGQPSNSLDNTIGFSTNEAPTSAFGFPPSLLDVERIEVLRGPQGTLFGRNALGGVVNVVTRPADGEREFTAKGEVGTDGYYLAEGIAAGSLAKDVLAARFAVRVQSRDGDIPNIVVGGTEGDIDIAALRNTLRFTPDEDLTVDLVVGYDRDERSNNYQLYREAPGFPVSGADIIPDNERERFETTLRIEKAFQSFTLTSQSNFQNIQLTGKNDIGEELLLAATGFTPPRGADLALTDDRERIFSQEIRFNSLPDSRVSWVAGASYFRSEYDSLRNQGSSFSPFSSGLFDTEITSQTFAGFADVTVPLTKRLSVSGGLRMARDRQELGIGYTSLGFPGTVADFTNQQSLSDSYVTGRTALSFDWTDDLTTYASVSRGYSSGGFERFTLNAAVGGPPDAFDPSTAWAGEIGAKAKVWNNRIELSGALFYNTIRDGQLVGFDISRRPTVFNFVNQDYETYGAELEGRAQLTEDLRVRAGFGITESSLGDTTDTIQFGAREGNQVPNSPFFNAFVDVNYQVNPYVYVEGQYEYVGDRQADIANSYTLEDYHVINAALGVQYRGFDVYAFGRNLLDERPEYFAATFADNVHSVVIGNGRLVGVGLKKTF